MLENVATELGEGPIPEPPPEPPSEPPFGPQPGILLPVGVPVKKTSAAEIDRLVGPFNDYRKVGTEVIRFAREIRDRIDKGGESGSC